MKRRLSTTHQKTVADVFPQKGAEMSGRLSLTGVLCFLLFPQQSSAETRRDTILFQDVGGKAKLVTTYPESRVSCGGQICQLFGDSIHGPAGVSVDFLASGPSPVSVARTAYIGDVNGIVTDTIIVLVTYGGGFNGMAYMFFAGGRPSSDGGTQYATCASVGGCEVLRNGSVQLIGTAGIQGYEQRTDPATGGIITVNIDRTDTISFQSVDECTRAAPAITEVTAAPRVLWPPDHKLKNVQVNYKVSAPCGTTPVCSLAVSSNEPITVADWQIVDEHNLLLRSERAGNGAGRVYMVHVACRNTGDAAGSESSTAVTVLHDKGSAK